MQIINNQSKNRGAFYSSQTENYSPEDSFLVALGIYPREAWFSAVLYLIRTKNIKHDQGTFLQVLKKKKKKKKDRLAHPVSQYDLGAGKGSLSSKEYLHWCPRKWGIYLCLQNRHSLLLDSTPFSLRVRAAVQYTCDGHRQNVLTGIKFKPNHVQARKTSSNLNMWKFLPSTIRNHLAGSTSLVVQWLKICDSTAGDTDVIPV